MPCAAVSAQIRSLTAQGEAGRMNMSDDKPRKGAIWSLYSKRFSEEEIRIEFTAKHGYPPQTVYFTGGGWLAGPLRPGEQIARNECVVTGVEL